jgi:hypothetical protein
LIHPPANLGWNNLVNEKIDTNVSSRLDLDDFKRLQEVVDASGQKVSTIVAQCVKLALDAVADEMIEKRTRALAEFEARRKISSASRVAPEVRKGKPPRQ